MGDFATINTGRYRVRYRTQGQTHAITFRTSRESTTPVADGASVATAFLDALAPWRFDDWAVLGAEYAGPDSELFFPTTAPAIVPGEAPPNNIAQRTVFTSFQGRSTAGSRASLYVYGINSDPVGASAAEHDFRYVPGEFAVVQDALTALNANSALLVAIDNAPVIWNQYANIGYNAYYQRKQRG